MGKIASTCILLVAFAGSADGMTFTTIDEPNATHGTQIFGVSGNNVVGSYYNASGGQDGFAYNGTTFTTLDDPLALQGQDFGTIATGMSGNTIVGTYNNLTGGFGTYGFTYDGTNYKTLKIGPDPTGDGLVPHGIDGSRIVGDSLAGGGGFLYDGSTFTQINDPFSQDGTEARGVSGNIVVGTYRTVNSIDGFLYNGSTYMTLDNPAASVAHGGTWPQGISGNNVVGFYFDNNGLAHGFLYNGSTFTTIDDPLASRPQNPAPIAYGTVPEGISGNTIVGYYTDANGVDHGFITTVPEPSSIALLAIGIMGSAALARRKRLPEGHV